MNDITIDFPPGVVNTASKRKKTGSWREANLIRWEGVTLRPVGGWEEIDYPAFASRCRASHKWNGLDGNTYTAYLCEEHCYVDIDGVLTDITPTGGLEPPIGTDEGGYGDLLYGDGTYGTPRSSRQRTLPATPCFTLDNWGGELRAMTSPDGRLLRWDPASPASLLTAVTNAPTGNRSFAVTPERHIILFGMDGDASQYGWCDQENDTNWDFASTTSKAGKNNVEPRSPIVAHKSVGSDFIVFTNRASYNVRYVGLPYIYSAKKIVDCPTPLSAASITETPEGAFWGAVNGFWLYNGVNIAPVVCPIWDWIDGQIAVDDSRFEASMINVAAKSEAWFFFVSVDHTENNRVAIYNYKEKFWTMGRLGRTCGVGYSNDTNPFMSDGFKVYRHEVGFNYPDAEELPWAETFTVNIMDGVNMMTIHQMLPEITGPTDNISYNFIKSSPQLPETISATKTIKANGYVDVRETARDFRVRVNMVGNDEWTMGPVSVDVKPRGRK